MKLFCGIKLTHDGGVALIEDGKLIFSIETEKLANNHRYSGIGDISLVEKLLQQYGYDPSQVDNFSVDGWEDSIIPCLQDGNKIYVKVAGYREIRKSQDVLTDYRNQALPIGKTTYDYSSYLHVTGHIMSAYCSSPFAREEQDSYVLVWDGGMLPRLYYVDARSLKVTNLGKVHFLIGNFYSGFASYFEPFGRENTGRPGELNELSIAGKVMAYIAKGEPREEIIDVFENILQEDLAISLDFVHVFAKKFIRKTMHTSIRHEDILASMHVFLERQLIRGLKDKTAKYPFPSRNLCFSGGCALNIKWNSAIRAAGLFDQMWVPPFPNDSGSAIGAACASMRNYSGRLSLDWQVYQGPALIRNEPASEWLVYRFSISQLARFLYTSNEPVVFLHDRAELGPRALGNRSILATAIDENTKTRLNDVKQRESYRPVAPICLEEEAEMIFDPGTPDPLMLYDHQIRVEWQGRIPAVRHLDGSARLQTVNASNNPLIYQLLREYFALSGIPLLCNTSANYKGKGFFPDVYSATDWGRLNFVWCDHRLYVKKSYELFVPADAALDGTALLAEGEVQDQLNF
ncbi:MAG TPA: carbamoyltransferase N-terminal domain-containing protein [Puia sp.]|nr:carbamoyltransferase N-terminal domain-containing protein [Puia sp.]